jgi:thiol-disulfide isomerase/thioredoxin
MDRLSALIAIALVGACDEPSAPGGASSRVDSVKGRARVSAVADLCDVHLPADRAPTFALPALAGAAPPTVAGWRWINLWATWCKPCRDEMPRLLRWEATQRPRLSLVFVSADESDDVVAGFRAAHPEVPPGPRLADPDALPTWLVALGLDAAAPIPIHVLVDPTGHTRCVRAGAVSDLDLAAAAQLIAQP